MSKSHRTERHGRRPVIAVPVLFALTGTIAIFTLALVAGADGSWRRIHFIFIAITVLVAGIALAGATRGRQLKAIDPDLVPEQFHPDAAAGQPTAAAAPQPPLTGTIVGTDVQVEVAQPAVS